MVGIKLNAEQIQTAPPEVRRWLDQQIGSSTMLPESTASDRSEKAHLVACTPQDVVAIYEAVQHIPPVVNVYFELGREGEGVEFNGLGAFRLTDIVRHARLADLLQLDICLQILNRALREHRRDANATLYFMSAAEYCVVAAATRQSISGLWNEMVSLQQLQALAGTMEPSHDPDQAAFFPFAEESGRVPASSMHMGNAYPIKP
ncbi:hypothetical protein [Methylovirgula sp. 4M-Z18]|uniref:hypothetical protein n=1 Tax=Methylovirgula sp. 4M-Z18 TaxID=2293567 RepID=UPI000E2FDC9F|nr:hypothetical protein [Methylovirgula sp. 4M-Z18]RFB76460.1 hypothetical protein DYH55_20175 [Methylovirgula sp. 4M-Z18]